MNYLTVLILTYSFNGYPFESRILFTSRAACESAADVMAATLDLELVLLGAACVETSVQSGVSG